MGMGGLPSGNLALCVTVLVLLNTMCIQTAGLMMSELYADGDNYDDSTDEDEGALESLCDLQDCLELYQAAQDSLRIRHDVPRSRHRPGGRHAQSSGGRSFRAHCEALRTFYLCIQNMSQSCLGNLYFHSSRRVAEKQMKSLNCSLDGPVFERPVAIPRPGGYLPQSPAPDSACVYRGPQNHQYCAVFGDPHLWTYDGSRHTCRMNGAWPLVDNNYLSVQVTSETLPGGGSAVAKVTVVVKRYRDCISSRYVTYQATSAEPLSATFDSGVSAYGAADTVRVMNIVAGHHVEIELRHAATLVVLRKHGRHFSVAIRTPAKVATAFSGALDVQLCTVRCPVAERLTLRHLSSSATASTETATKICRQHGLVDFFLDACVFDFVATGGDRNFSVAAVHALRDYRRLSDDASSRPSSRTTPRNASHASCLTAATVLLYLIASLLSAALTRNVKIVPV